MSEPFIGEIKTVGFNFAPRGWALCNGQILPISQNQSLYALLGTTYGGDGRTSFALPDLRGRTAVHVGQGPGLTHQRWGERGGENNTRMVTNQMPAHNHKMSAHSEDADETSPTGSILAGGGALRYSFETADTTMGDMVQNTGSGLAQNNMQPYLAVNHVIALQGLFPSRS